MLSPGGSAGGGVGGQLSRPAKDPNWLTLEVCREFARNKCGRAEEECKFAHPPPHIDIQNGRVTCCFDSLQGRCQRIDPPCKYFHPPEHLRDQLSHSRRSFPAVGVHYQPLAQPSSPLAATPLPFVNPYLLQNAVGAFSPFLAQALAGHQPSYSEIAVGADCTGAASNPLTVMVPATTAYTPPSRSHRSDRMEVCREYQRGVCTRTQSECRYAHPPNGMAVDADNHVTVCMDFIKGRCHRETCRYFHPPLHLQAQIKTSQQRAVGMRPPAISQLVNVTQSVMPTYMPTMTAPTTYPTMLTPATGTTVVSTAATYQQQAAMLAALQLQQLNIADLSLADRRPPSSETDRY